MAQTEEIGQIAEKTNICPHCHQKVFFNERGPPFLTHTYHARCFKCTGCSRVLNAGNFLDHEGKQYCNICYERLFAGNRKMYAAPHQRASGEIDKADPLKDMRSSTKNGKLDIKQYSKKLNIPDKLIKSQKKSSEHNVRLHRYMLGTSNVSESVMMDGRMKFVYHNLQKRLHKMVIHQCYSLQQKLIERVDHILQQEVLEFDHLHLMQQRQTLFDPKSIDEDKQSVLKKNKELHQIQRTLETHLHVPDFSVKHGIKDKENTETVSVNDDESDLDTQELITRLANNKLL